MSEAARTYTKRPLVCLISAGFLTISAWALFSQVACAQMPPNEMRSGPNGNSYLNYPNGEPGPYYGPQSGGTGDPHNSSNSYAQAGGGYPNVMKSTGGDNGGASGMGYIADNKQQSKYDGSLSKNKSVTLNFVAADISSVARTMSAITGRNVVIDPSVKGTITLQIQDPVSPKQAYSLFTSMLRLQGYAIVKVGDVDKIVPFSEARVQETPVEVGTGAQKGQSNQIVTKVFRLQYASANYMQMVVRSLLSPSNNSLAVNPTSNSVIVTDYADNLKRISQVVAALDTPMATKVVVIPLKYAVASELAPLISKLADGSGSQPSMVDGSYKTTIFADTRSNSLIVRTANDARREQVEQIIAALDKAPQDGDNGASGNIYVVHLKNADATELATTLRAALSADNTMSSQADGAQGGMPGGFGGPPGGMGGGPNSFSRVGGVSPTSTLMGADSSGGGGGGFGSSGGMSGSMPGMAGIGSSSRNGSATGGQIQADPTTNSLIITCSAPQYRQLRAVIDKLDAPRPQVFVESLIVEVNENKATQLGIQWQGPVGNTGGPNIGFMGTNFGTGAQGNILNLSGALNNPSAFASGGAAFTNGLNLGFAHKFGGVYVLGALANFLETTGAGNVLSTPNLLTLDNSMASIMVGQEVPFVTGSSFNTTAGSNNSNAFNTIERKNVGLQLKILPRISADGMINMQIYQEVSDIDNSANGGNTQLGPITNKRSLQTDVLVKDGSIVVLGGLLQDNYTRNRNKVPLLGDIPILGRLFGNESRSLSKKNLMIFLRPVVIWDNAQSSEFAQGRYEDMRSLQQDTQPSYSKVQPITQVPVLPKYEDKALSGKPGVSEENRVLNSSVQNQDLSSGAPVVQSVKPGQAIPEGSVKKGGFVFPQGTKFEKADSHKKKSEPVVTDGNDQAIQFGS